MVSYNNAADHQATQYNVLTGGASNVLNNVAPSATSGVPLVSGGSSSQPSFTTAVVAGGGTGVATMTTAYAPVCAGTTATGALQVASTGLSTSGFVLTSTGSSSLPSFQAVPSSSVVVQQVRSISTTGDSTASNYTNAAAPTTSNGKQFFSIAITPTNTAHVLVINATLTGTNAAATYAILALFQDSNATALASTILSNGGAGEGYATWNLTYSVAAGTTSATTFKLRYGASGGTMYINRDSGGNNLGTTLTSTMTITEYTS